MMTDKEMAFSLSVGSLRPARPGLTTVKSRRLMQAFRTAQFGLLNLPLKLLHKLIYVSTD